MLAFNLVTHAAKSSKLEPRCYWWGRPHYISSWVAASGDADGSPDASWNNPVV